MIELVYSQQSTGFDKSLAYSNPRFFTTPRSDVSKVYVVGDWPKVVAAYEAMGVPVERLGAAPKAPEPVTATMPPALEQRIKAGFPVYDPRADETIAALAAASQAGAEAALAENARRQRRKLKA